MELDMTNGHFLESYFLNHQEKDLGEKFHTTGMQYRILTVQLIDWLTDWLKGSLWPGLHAQANAKITRDKGLGRKQL